MRIVTLEEFRTMPEGTLYSAMSEDGAIGNLRVKQDMGDNWTYLELSANSFECPDEDRDIAIADMRSGIDLEMIFDLPYNSGMDDTVFDSDSDHHKMFFAVFSKSDVRQLIGELLYCL